MTTIAALIPVYNKRPHVEAAIRSVLAQTRPVDEIIVVDDASTDGSREVVEGFDDPRIRLLRRDTPGPGGYAARNAGIRAARSDWIAFLDADDAWYDRHLEDVAGLIAEADMATVGVFTGWERVWPDGRTRRDLYSAVHKDHDRTRLDFDQFLASWLELGTPPTWTSACAFRRERLVEAGLFPEGRCRRGGDKDMWLRVMALGSAISTTRISAAYHQETANQVTQVVGGAEPHCIWPTLDALSQDAPPERRDRLAQLKRSDDFHDFRRAAMWERISPIQAPPGAGQARTGLRSLALRLVTRLPPAAQRRLVSLWRRRRSAAPGSSGS